MTIIYTVNHISKDMHLFRKNNCSTSCLDMSNFRDLKIELKIEFMEKYKNPKSVLRCFQF